MGVHAMQGELRGCACNAVGLQRVCMQCRVIGEGVGNAVGLQHVCMQCRVRCAIVYTMQGELHGCACNAVGLQYVCVQCRVIGEGVHAMQFCC